MISYVHGFGSSGCQNWVNYVSNSRTLAHLNIKGALSRGAFASIELQTNDLVL